MKTVGNCVSAFVVALSMGLLAACGSRSGIPDKPDVGMIDAGRELDHSLLALANDPTLLLKIDQRKNFTSEDAYRGVLQKALGLARKPMPAVLSDDGVSHFTTSVCVADYRVYFWSALGDRDLIGWVSTPEITDHSLDIPVLTVLVIPQLHKESPFAECWREQAKEESDSSTRVLVKAALGIDIGNGLTGDGEEIHWIARIDGSEHSVTVCRSGNVLQVEMGLLPDVCIGKPGKPLVSKPVLTFMPRELLFWPPK